MNVKTISAVAHANPTIITTISTMTAMTNAATTKPDDRAATYSPVVNASHPNAIAANPATISSQL